MKTSALVNLDVWIKRNYDECPDCHGRGVKINSRNVCCVLAFDSRPGLDRCQDCQMRLPGKGKPTVYCRLCNGTGLVCHECSTGGHCGYWACATGADTAQAAFISQAQSEIAKLKKLTGAKDDEKSTD